MKLIKNIYLAMAAVAVAGTLASCGDSYFDETPGNAVDASTAIKTSDNLKTARTGMYAALKGTSSFTDYYAANMWVYGDVRGEDLQYNQAYGSNRASFYYYMTYSTASQFTQSTAVWQSPYIVIGRACRIIEAADSGSISDAAENADVIAQYRAEALVLRALATFDLTRIYGKTYTEDNGASLGVPIVTSSLSSNAKPARSTVAEDYAQVLSDLKDAINSGALPTTVTTGYVNQWAAKALLTRVYLTMGDWQNALTTAEDIIQNSPYSLWTTNQYATAWEKDNAAHSNEMLFELNITGSTDWTDREGIAYLYAENGATYGGYGDIVATKTFVDSLSADPQDVRNNIFLAPEADDNNVFNGAKVYLNKFQPHNGDVRYANIPMLRLSEVYLSAAEAAFNLGQTDKAADYLNAIISNRTTDATKLVTATTVTADRISWERRKELVGEGQRFFDAVRHNETITRYTDANNRGWHDILTEDARSYNRDYFKALPAIPSYEANANKNIEQNPGYGE